MSYRTEREGEGIALRSPRGEEHLVSQPHANPHTCHSNLSPLSHLLPLPRPTVAMADAWASSIPQGYPWPSNNVVNDRTGLLQAGVKITGLN